MSVVMQYRPRTGGGKLINPTIGQTLYWIVSNQLLNMCKAPSIPSLLIDNKFVISCKAKTVAFNKHSHCKPLCNNRTLPTLNF